MEYVRAEIEAHSFGKIRKWSVIMRSRFAVSRALKARRFLCQSHNYVNVRFRPEGYTLKALWTALCAQIDYWTRDK